MNTGRPRDCDDEAVLIAARAMLFCGRYPSAMALCPILGRRWSIRTCHSSLQRLRASGRLLEPMDGSHEARERARMSRPGRRALKAARCLAGRLLTSSEIDRVLGEIH